MDKAPDFGSGDCRFESCHDRFLFLHANVSMMKLFISVRLERPRGCWVTFDRNQVRSSATLLSNSLTNVVETDLMWPWRMKMPNQNLIILLLLMLMMRNVLATVCLRFWRWRLLKISRLRFGQDFEVEVQLGFWSWSLVKMSRLKFGPNFVAKDWSTFWARIVGEIWKLNRDSEAQFWPTCDMTWKQLFWWKHETLGSVVPLANFFTKELMHHSVSGLYIYCVANFLLSTYIQRSLLCGN